MYQQVTGGEASPAGAVPASGEPIRKNDEGIFGSAGFVSEGRVRAETPSEKNAMRQTAAKKAEILFGRVSLFSGSDKPRNHSVKLKTNTPHDTIELQ